MSDLANEPTQVLADATGAAPYVAPVVFANRYEVRTLLGQGGMGSVFRVHDRELDEDVALKVLLGGSTDPSIVNRFRREVRLARRVTHPNVARTYDLGQHDDVKFLTMELVIGEALSSFVTRFAIPDGGKPRGKLPLGDALRIAEQIARGLSAAHAVGVVHRDLKPDNVMLCSASNGRIVITDFGIARLAEGMQENDARRTTHQQVVGTPAYMAPEQAKNDPIDGRTDVYALATLLFEMLVGVTPFRRQGVLAMLAARLTDDAPDIRSFDVGIPEPVALLLKSALSRRREERPDAEMMLQAIERLRGAGDRHDHAPELVTSSTTARFRLPNRSIAVAPVDVKGSSMTWSGDDLGAAVADGLSILRGLEVLPPSLVREKAKSHDGDMRAGARELGASFLLDMSLREDGTQARARARLVDVEKGAQVWAAVPIDVAAHETFALEDRLVRVVTDALRERLGEGGARSTDPEVQSYCDRAAEAERARTIPAIREAIRILEEGRAKHPTDAWLLCLLAGQIVRLWSATGAVNASLATRAEELALRALAADPTLGQAYHTIGMLRLEQGEMRACVRAFQEALARAPLYSEPHIALGTLLAETGNVDEARRRLDAALRLEPGSVGVLLERARMRALLGDRDGAESDLRELGHAGTSLLVRAVVWWKDRERARALAEAFEKAPTGAAWEVSGPFLRSFSIGGEPFAEAAETLRKISTLASVSARNNCRLAEAGADWFAAMGDREHALELLENAAATLPYVNVLWLDRSPSLDKLRDDPRFAHVRGVVATRAADLWR